MRPVEPNDFAPPAYRAEAMRHVERHDFAPPASRAEEMRPVERDNVAPRAYRRSVQRDDIAPRAYRAEQMRLVERDDLGPPAYRAEGMRPPVEHDNLVPRAYKVDEMRPVEPDNLAPRAYRLERSRMHRVELDPEPYSGVMEQSLRRQRSLSPRRVERHQQVSWHRSGDQDFSDILEPQLRSGLMERVEEFSDRVNIMQQPPTYRQVHEEPRYHCQGSLSREETGRKYEFDYEDRYEDGGTRVHNDYEYEYDSATSVQGHNVNAERVLGSEHHHGLDRQKLLALEDRSSRGARNLPFDSESVHVQHQQVRLRDEVAHYPDPFLLDKLSAIERLEREERSRFHPEDVSLYVESASQSKDFAASSQYKERLTTSSGISRMNYAPAIQDDMHLRADIHGRSSRKFRQPLPLNEYGENHIYNTLDDYAAGHKELTIYQSDNVSSPRGDDMDYLYPTGRPRDTTDYGHSYERTSLLEQAVLDRRHARARILLEPLRENFNDAEFPQREVINSSSWDHSSLNKQSVSMSVFDGRSSGRSSQGQFYVDSGDTNVGMQNVRESDVENLDVPCHEEIPRRRIGYHISKDGHFNSYDEMWRRSPRHGHEMEMLGDRVRLKCIESGVIGCDGHPIRSVKRKYNVDEETMGDNSRRVVCSKWKKNINRKQDIDYRNEVWDDQVISGLLSPESFENDKWFGKAERTYSGDLYGRVAATDGLLSYHSSINQGQRHLTRRYSPDKKQKVHESPSSLRPYVSIQCNRKRHLTKNVWIRGNDDKQTEASDHVVEGLKGQAACAKTELPEDSLEFKQLIHTFFLSYSKNLNESFGTKKRYKEQGRAGGLFCIVCAKSQSKEFKDTRALAVHCYMTQKVGLKAKHLGLHKAICVLMGWNSDAPPEGKLWAPVAVPTPNALAQKEDLILWPPVVVIHNCSTSVTGLDEQKVMTTEAVEDFLRGKGFSGGRMKICLGKPGNGSVLLVKFLDTIPGFQDAEKLHNYFMGEERGRKELGAVISTKGKDIKRRNVKEGNVEEFLLYGYMGIAEDLNKVDNDTKRKCIIKSKEEIRDFVDAPVVPVVGD